jgi:predicted DCC family thiol-disulfide oxidoreductase YuxK
MTRVIYDADCGLCLSTRRICEALDWFHLLDWNSFEDSGIRPDQIFLESRGRRWGGFSAVKRIALRLPLFYLAILAGVLASPWTLAFWVFAYSPLFQPMGERLYGWVARNRTCAI